MTVKRYEPGCAYVGEEEMIVASDGDYVSYEDYAELQRKLEALAAENCIQDFIISAVKEITGESTGVVGWHLNGDIASWDEVLPELNHSDTPATDAALAEIRAQGVDEFGIYHNCSGKMMIQVEAKKYAEKMRKESGR